MAQIHVTDETIDRIEKITCKKFTRGGNRLINEAFDILEGKNPKNLEGVKFSQDSVSKRGIKN